MAGQWPCRGVGFSEIQGRTSGNPINLESQRGFDKGRYTSSPWTGTEDVRTEPVGVVSRSILMVPLKAPGEHTTPPNDSLPCVCNESQMCFGPVQRPQSEEETGGSPPGDGRGERGQGSWSQSHDKTTARCPETPTRTPAHPCATMSNTPAVRLRELPPGGRPADVS